MQRGVDVGYKAVLSLSAAYPLFDLEYFILPPIDRLLDSDYIFLVLR
jgi:hypothetical protein